MKSHKSGQQGGSPFVNTDVVSGPNQAQAAINAVNPPAVPFYTPPALSPISTPSQMPVYQPDFSINANNFDQLLSQRGVRMVHEKATPCPNILTLDSNAHEPNCSFCDNNGFLFYGREEIFGVFSGNSIQKTFEAHGVWEIGSAVVTLPSHYPDGREADFNGFDRLVLPDFTVRLWELKEYEPRPGNVQELRYPVRSVDYVSSISKDGKTERRYTENVDFTINADGEVVWIDGRQPHYDAHSGHGEVLTWSFYSAPVYLVVQVLRELRVTQELNARGQKVPRKLPQQVLVKRDFLPTAAETIVKP
jgi:hypothetical protein